MPSLSRRQVLRAGWGGSIVGVAGCLKSLGQTAGDGCNDEKRWDITFRSLGYATHEGFQLTAEPATVAFGDDILFRLRNVTVELLYVGTDGNYTIQERHDGDWRTIFSTEEGMMWDGSAQEVAPDEVAFTWTFTVTNTGFDDSRYALCQPLTVGTYRFAYWTLPDRPPTATAGDSSSTHHAVAVRFTIEK